MRPSLATLFIAPFLASVGCGKIAGFEDFHLECPAEQPDCRSAGGAGGGNGSGGSEGGTAAATGGSSSAGNGNGGAGGLARTDGGDGCDSSRRGPAMAFVSRPNGDFWMDRTEVTVGQYDAFLQEHGAVQDHPLCPSGPQVAPGCEGTVGAPANAKLDPDLPQTCVDWCDAKAYCIWAGKDLCSDASQSTGNDLLENSEFYFACTEGNGSAARYGCGSSSACTKVTCNGGPAGLHRAVPVGTTKDCVARPRPNNCPIADLSGNVEEWTNDCPFVVADAACTVRGGSFESGDTDLECATKTPYLRRTTSPRLGFRCCASP